MDSTSLTKPVDLQGLSLALAKTKADYEAKIDYNNSKPFYVEITDDMESEEEFAWLSDKTYSEIDFTNNDGVPVYFRYGDYEGKAIRDYDGNFYAMCFDFTSSTDTLMGVRIEIDSGDNVNVINDINIPNITSIPSNDFIITITQSGTAGNYTYSSDKTFNEIQTAYNSGKRCYAIYGSSSSYNVILPLCRMANALVVFSGVGTQSDSSDYLTYCIKINSSNEITWKSIYLNGRNITTDKETIAPRNYDASTTSFSSTAIQAYEIGDLFWRNYNVLAKATTAIASGDTLTENTNYVVTTIENELNDVRSSMPSNLVDLDDTNITSLRDGQILTYDGTSSKWINGGIPNDANKVDAVSTGINNGRFMFSQGYSDESSLFVGYINSSNHRYGLEVNWDYSVALNGLAEPINDDEAANKKYVDDALSNVSGDLIGLTDTSISSPTNGQILMYNSTTSKWENASLPIYGGEVTEIWNGGNY